MSESHRIKKIKEDVLYDLQCCEGMISTIENNTTRTSCGYNEFKMTALKGLVAVREGLLKKLGEITWIEIRHIDLEDEGDNPQ